MYRRHSDTHKKTGEMVFFFSLNSGQLNGTYGTVCIFVVQRLRNTRYGGTLESPVTD